MNWINFEKKFLATAKQNKYSNKYIQDWLSYAKILYNNKVPIIFDYLHFSYLVGIHHTYIFKVANAPGKFYRTFKIPKKSGGLRVIKEPLPNLKIIQRWILNNILIYQPISEFTKAYRIGHSIKDNARFHLNQKILLKIDIENYFGTIHSKNVYCFFRSLGYTKQLSTLFTNLCCLDHSLPQGATTSPMLSNILTIKLDEDISSFAKMKNIRYTRYADDITLSGDFNPKETISMLKKLLNKHGFKTNSEKTRVKYPHQQQIVTGIVVNKKMQAPRKERKKIRQTMYYINKFGPDSHMKKTSITMKKEDYIKHLLGKIHSMYFLNQNDEELESYIADLKNILDEM